MSQEFSVTMNEKINHFINLSDLMIRILTELKESLLLFDSKKLNKVLDEKMVLSEELTAVNNEVVTIIREKYGDFSEAATDQFISDYPQLKSSWQILKTYMKSIKNLLQDIRRVLCSLDKYNQSMMQGVKTPKKPGYGYLGKHVKRKVTR